MERNTHDPQVFLEGRGSLVNPVGAPLQDAEREPAPEGDRFLSVSRDAAGSPSSTAPAQSTCSSPSGPIRVAGWPSLVLTSLAPPADRLALLRRRGIPYQVVGQRQ